MEYQKIERIFSLPSNADADIVAETVRAIICTSGSTEKLILTTDPPEIHATLYINNVPDSEDSSDVVSMWDVLHRVHLDALPVEEDISVVLRLVNAIQFLAKHNRVAMAIGCRSVDAFWEYVDFPKATRFLNLPVLETPRLDTGKIVILGGASSVSGIIHSTHGVLLDVEEQ